MVFDLFLHCVTVQAKNLDYILLNLLISYCVTNKPKPRNENVNAVYIYLLAEIFESVARSLFMIN